MTAILTRVAADNSPVVFIADSLKDGQIKAWTGGANLKTVGVDFYQQTQPLSESDSEHLRKRYAKATGQDLENVFVRQRLPRVYKARPDIFAGAGKAANQAQAATQQQANKGTGRADAAREQMARDIAGAAGPGATTAQPGANLPPEFVAQMEDPRFAALVLKLADILKPAL